MSSSNDKLTCRDGKQRELVWGTQRGGLGAHLGGGCIGVYFYQNPENCMHLKHVHVLHTNYISISLIGKEI